MRVGVEHAGEPGALEEEPHEELAVVVALLLGPLADDVGQRVRGVQPLGHDHLLAHRHHGGHHDVGVVVEGLGVRRLRLGLECVVELVGGARLELGHEGLDVEAGEDGRDAAGHPGDLAQVAHQRLAGAGVLHLDRDVSLVAVLAWSSHRPRWTCPMEAAAVGAPSSHTSRSPQSAPRWVVELLSHGRGRHRRSGVLERGEVLAVGSGDVLGQRGLEHAQRLAELHRPALELAQGAEELLGRALLHLAEHHVRGAATEPLAEAHRGATGVAQWQCCQPGRASGGLAWELGHGAIVPSTPIRCRSRSEGVRARA